MFAMYKKSPSNPSTKLHPLEFATFQKRPLLGRAGQKVPLGASHGVLIGVSSGADSTALLRILYRLQKRWGFKLEVAYVHHGDSAAKESARYRERAAKKVSKLAEAEKLKFHFIKLTGLRESEAAMREGRLAALEKCARENGLDVLALGHHEDDLFETRLIRLLRGTGPHGLMAMKSLSRTESGFLLWRPLLESTRSEIENYLAELGLKKSKDWLEDPTNKDARYLRNAIRRKLIPEIDKIRPGGAKAMARSLELFAEFVEANSEKSVLASQFQAQQALDRKALLGFSEERRRRELSNWVRSLGVREFSKAHASEMLKRIDTPRRRFRFELCGRVWSVDASIRLVP